MKATIRVVAGICMLAPAIGCGSDESGEGPGGNGAGDPVYAMTSNVWAPTARPVTSTPFVR